MQGDSQLKEFIRNRKLRIGVVGCGRISARHFEAIAAHSKNIELVGVCDTHEGRRTAAAKSMVTKGYARLEELLTDSNPDIVTLCTPSGLHPGQAIFALESGKHVITEKPMATRWEDGLKMIAAADAADRLLFVVKQNRHNSTLQALKKAIDSNRFGKIYSVAVNVFWTRPQDYYDSDPWRGTWEFDGGALMNQASHYIDLLDWLVGPLESLYAYTGTLARKIEVEDTAALALRWRSGALGTVNVSMLTYPKNLEGSITILGEKGTVKVGGVAVNEIQHWEFAESAPEDESLKAHKYQTASVYGPGHPIYYENVVQTLRGEVDHYTSGRQGLRSLEILIAAYTSSRDRKPIGFPLKY